MTSSIRPECGVSLPRTRRSFRAVYRLRGRAGGGIATCAVFWRASAHRTRAADAQRPELKARVIHEVGPEGTRGIAFLDALPLFCSSFGKQWRNTPLRPIRRFGSAAYAAAEILSGLVLVDLGIAYHPRFDHAAS